MYYALVHYLNDYPAAIDAFRMVHDPRFLVTPPHLTLVFPVDASIGEKALVSHISSVLKDWKPFEITLKRVRQSWDNYIFLLLSSGNDKFIKLHDDLYTGLLGPHLRIGSEYIPHVTIGVLKDLIDMETIAEAESMNVEALIKIDRLQLIRCTDDRTQHDWEKVFMLG